MTKQELEAKYQRLKNEYDITCQKLKEAEYRLSDYDCSGRFVATKFHEDKVRQIKEECYQTITRLSKLIR